MALHLLFGDKQLTECLLLLSTEDTLIVMTPLLAKALKADLSATFDECAEELARSLPLPMYTWPRL